MKPAAQKKTEAEARNAAHQALTPQQRLAKLDQAFGKGQGAKKERAKLEGLLNKAPAPAPAPSEKPVREAASKTEQRRILAQTGKFAPLSAVAKAALGEK